MKGILATLLFVMGVGITGLACPDQTLTIRISETGMATVLAACRGFQKLCKTLDDCKEDPLSCALQNGQCVLRNRCRLGDDTHPGWTALGKKAAQFFLVSIEGARIADKTRCFSFDSSGCMGDRACFADLLNRQLDELLKSGMSFDGFNEPGEVLLGLAVFDAEGESEPSCHPDKLITCAGLAPPLGGGDYDITCASCQDGSHFSLGRDNGPCPIGQGQCFLKRCDQWLRASK